jgi:predicted DNA-binding WGR domain protein
MQQYTDTTALPHHIHLQAIDMERNIARNYRIEGSIDLFGHVIIALHWGRIGTRGQCQIVSFPHKQAAERFVLNALRRRKSAKRRIGVAYREVA